VTIQQTIDIPASRKVHLDITLPEDMPCGRTELVLDFRPSAAHAGASGKPRLDPILEKALREAEEKWAYNQAHPEELKTSLARLRENGPLFGGADGVEFQRKIRDEWEDRPVKPGLSGSAG
jgi:hypothetical protein